jgi:hypothetical protein
VIMFGAETDGLCGGSIVSQMLMGTTVSAFEQPILAKGGGVCTDKSMDYSPLAQPCANDFAKSGMYSKDTTVSRMEVRRRRQAARCSRRISRGSIAAGKLKC